MDINDKRVNLRCINDGNDHYDMVSHYDPTGYHVEFEDYKKLYDTIQWVITDASYKAPEQVIEASQIWIARLQQALKGE